MAPERRATWDKRKTERRLAGRILRLDDSNFRKEILDVPVLGLVQFGCKWSGACKKQEKVLRLVAQDFKQTQALRMGLFDVSIDNAQQPWKLGVRVIPTLVLYFQGKVLHRWNGSESRTSIKKTVNEILIREPDLYVERRRGDRREAADRRERGTAWRSLGKELASSPWPVVVSINPEAPAEAKEFSSLVESCADAMRKQMITTLHVKGSPTELARRHFGLSVEAPAVAVFYEERLIGQFDDIHSKADLKRKIQSVLP